MSPRRIRATAPPDRITVAKDLILFLIGAGLICWQGFVVPPPDFNWIIMAAGGILAGVPGWLQLWGLRTSDTSLPLRPSPADSSPSPSPPSSSE